MIEHNLLKRIAIDIVHLTLLLVILVCKSADVDWYILLTSNLNSDARNDIKSLTEYARERCNLLGIHILLAFIFVVSLISKYRVSVLK